MKREHENFTYVNLNKVFCDLSNRIESVESAVSSPLSIMTVIYDENTTNRVANQTIFYLPKAYLPAAHLNISRNGVEQILQKDYTIKQNISSSLYYVEFKVATEVEEVIYVEIYQ